MSMECPKCRTRAWAARCPDCGYQLLPEDGAVAPTSFELDVKPAPARRASATMAVTGMAPRARALRPPAASVAPLTLERPWDRRLAWGWGIVGILMPIASLRGTAQLPLRVGLAAVGVAFIYAALCFAFNGTTLRIASGRLFVVRGPLPAGGNQRIPLDDVEQIFVRMTQHSRRKYPWMRYWSPREHYLRYHVVVHLTDGDERKLVGDFEDVYEARQFERTLEDHIGITDDPMRGQ